MKDKNSKKSMEKNTVKKTKKRKNNNINFIFGLLDKKKMTLILIIKAFLDFIYYIVPFSFTLFLTMPFTIKKAMIVATIFIASKTIGTLILYLKRKIYDNYLYDYANIQYLEYYKQLTKVPVETLSKYQTGFLQDIISKISMLVRRILHTEYIGIVMSFSFFFYITFNQSRLLFFASLILSIICLLLSIYILKKANKNVEELYDKEYEYSGVYQDFLSNIRTVKALNNNKYFENLIQKEGKECYVKNKKYVTSYSLEELVRNGLIIIPFAIAIMKAVYDLSYGIDTLGIIAFYISTYLDMGFIFSQLSETIVNWFELKALKKKVIELFNKLDERKLLTNFNKIELKDIILRYEESTFDILVDDLVINKNDKISIIGKSGQGKTSVINLLLGNIDTYTGTINIDKTDIKDIRLDIGIVSQEIELFNMTIKDNLCLDRNLPDEEIINYLKELELDEILMFENGIYTTVGEKGLKLSTGQKRRINILRSYLMNKDIYILDEPTSNLDKHTEEVVINFIFKYFKDKTLIIATHNEKINEFCNKFYYFKDHKLLVKE